MISHQKRKITGKNKQIFEKIGQNTNKQLTFALQAFYSVRK